MEQEKIINENEFIIFSLQRCGTHPIKNWIAEQCDEPVHYTWVYGGGLDYHKDPLKRYFMQGTLNNCVRRPFEKNEKKKYLMYSYENLDLETLGEDYVLQRRKELFGESKKVYYIIILRDPFNFISSRLQFQLQNNKQYKNSGMYADKRGINIWKQYANEIIRETKYFEEIIFINYNKWFVNKKYRNEIAKKLGLKNKDKGLNTVINFGNGSSFDKLEYDGKAQKMKVLERWRKEILNDNYRKLFDAETVYLSMKIFGEIGAEKYLKYINTAKEV